MAPSNRPQFRQLGLLGLYGKRTEIHEHQGVGLFHLQLGAHRHRLRCPNQASSYSHLRPWGSATQRQNEIALTISDNVTPTSDIGQWFVTASV